VGEVSRKYADAPSMVAAQGLLDGLPNWLRGMLREWNTKLDAESAARWVAQLVAESAARWVAQLDLSAAR